MKDRLQLPSASITIFNLIDNNITILGQDGSIFIAHERDPWPDFLLKMKQEDFLYLRQQTEQDSRHCYKYTNDFEFTYLSKLVQLDDENSEHLWIIGPFLMQMPDMDRINTLFHTERHKLIILEEFIRSLKLFNNSKIQSIVNLLNNAGSLRKIPYCVLNTQPVTTDRLDANNIQHILQHPNEHNTTIIEIRYELEKDLMKAIEHGDELKLKSIMSEMTSMFDFSDRFPNQPVRAMKNMLIVLNTLLRSAAERGKVHPFFLHHISEKFSKQIERCDSVNSLNSLHDVMHEEYCNLVKVRAISGYSPAVQKVAQHINIHFSKPMNLNQLAEMCLIHPSHLSRQFKKEMGITLTDFQNKMRIDEAKLLLKKSNTSIDWIAGQVGFDDAGYFTRIFNKLEGMTPSKYRKLY